MYLRLIALICVVGVFLAVDAVAQLPYFSQVRINTEHFRRLRSYIENEYDRCLRWDSNRPCLLRQNLALDIGFGEILEVDGSLAGARWLYNGIWHTMLFASDRQVYLSVHFEAERDPSDREEILWLFDGGESVQLVAAKLKSSTRKVACSQSEQWPQCGVAHNVAEFSKMQRVAGFRENDNQGGWGFAR